MALSFVAARPSKRTSCQNKGRSGGLRNAAEKTWSSLSQCSAANCWQRGYAIRKPSKIQDRLRRLEPGRSDVKSLEDSLSDGVMLSGGESAGAPLAQGCSPVLPDSLSMVNRQSEPGLGCERMAQRNSMAPRAYSSACGGFFATHFLPAQVENLGTLPPLILVENRGPDAYSELYRYESGMDQNVIAHLLGDNCDPDHSLPISSDATVERCSHGSIRPLTASTFSSHISETLKLSGINGNSISASGRGSGDNTRPMSQGELI
jgi:hypothetical protein